MTTGLRSWDLRGSDGVYLRLRRRDGETEVAWIERRREHDRRAQAHEHRLMNRDDYEVVEKARVVATPGTLGGRPRIDGTRLAVSQLLIDIAYGETIESLSRERDYLAPAWHEAIMFWIDAHAVETEPMRRLLSAIPLGEHAEGLEMMRRRAERADPAAAMELLEQFGTEPPQPGDEMPDDVADAIERKVTPPLVVAPEGLPDSVAEHGRTPADIAAIRRGRAEAAAGGGHDIEDVLAEMDAIIADSEIPPELQWNSMDTLHHAAADFVARMAAAGYSADEISQAVALPIFGLTTDELTKKDDK